MKIATKIADASRSGERRRALVPTMGALHRAHSELMRVAREKAGKDGEVVVSIFVNPLQFEPGSDYERYPRPQNEDEEFCREAGVDLLFRPAVDEIYPSDRSVFVEEMGLSQSLEGKSRPGHFRGVCTVVAKLFNIIEPHVAVFGEKDFQQLAIIRRMVRDLNFNIDIVAVPTVREEDGLAFSSRNAYLSDGERKQAPALRAALLAAKKSGEKSAKAIIDFLRTQIGKANLGRIDYVSLVDRDTLEPIESVRPGAVLAVAVFFGKTRLIDNISLS